VPGPKRRHARWVAPPALSPNADSRRRGGIGDGATAAMAQAAHGGNVMCTTDLAGASLCRRCLPTADDPKVCLAPALGGMLEIRCPRTGGMATAAGSQRCRLMSAHRSTLARRTTKEGDFPERSRPFKRLNPVSEPTSGSNDVWELSGAATLYGKAHLVATEAVNLLLTWSSVEASAGPPKG